jgi:hypothetical protein
MVILLSKVKLSHSIPIEFMTFEILHHDEHDTADGL